MRFLADENIARSTLLLLRDLDHDVLDAKEQRWFGYADEKLLRIAARQRRIILTIDQDFGNILRFPPIRHQGVLLVQLRSPHPHNVNRILSDFLKHKSQSFFRRRLIVLNEWQVRIRE